MGSGALVADLVTAFCFPHCDDDDRAIQQTANTFFFLLDSAQVSIVHPSAIRYVYFVHAGRTFYFMLIKLGPILASNYRKINSINLTAN